MASNTLCRIQNAIAILIKSSIVLLEIHLLRQNNIFIEIITSPVALFKFTLGNYSRERRNVTELKGHLEVLRRIGRITDIHLRILTRCYQISKLANGSASNESIKHVWYTIAEIDSHKYSIVPVHILAINF